MAWFKSSEFGVATRPAEPGQRPSPKETFDTAMTVLSASSRPLPKKDFGFTIHSAKNGETNEIHQTSPTLTVAKARGLYKSGWQVHIADSAGRQYAPSEFDEILKFDR